ncbi:Hypp1898 [Branchiostoma lanceolatum]|uniref:Hypp1898 protein n=1 Tax=Branchiostoma lanceolatum TaxID=7740 RepID=A0A8J9ZN94_BRALA|nr:Hypp1898 [Branchiostoma lanceolatum]
MNNSKKENWALRQQRLPVPNTGIRERRHAPVPEPIPPSIVLGSQPLPPIWHKRLREVTNERVKKTGAFNFRDTQLAPKSRATVDNRYVKTSGPHHQEKLPQIKHMQKSNKVHSKKSSGGRNVQATGSKRMEVQQTDAVRRSSNTAAVEQHKGRTAEFTKQKKDSTAADVESQTAKACKPAKRPSSKRVGAKHQRSSLRTHDNEKMTKQSQERTLNPVALTSTKEMEEEWLKALSRFAREGKRQIDNMGAIKTDERTTPMMVEQNCIGQEERSPEPVIVCMKDVSKESDVMKSHARVNVLHQEKELTGNIKTKKRKACIAVSPNNDCKREENRRQRNSGASPQPLGFSSEDNGVHSRAPSLNKSRAPGQASSRAPCQDSSRAPCQASSRAPCQDSSRAPGHDKILKMRNSHKTGKQQDKTSLPSLTSDDPAVKGKKRCKPGVTLPSIGGGKRVLPSVTPPDLPDGMMDSELPPLEFGTKHVRKTTQSSVANECSKDKSKVRGMKRRQKVERTSLKDKKAGYREYQ